MGRRFVTLVAACVMLLLAVVSLSCLAPGAARADDSSIGTVGGSVHPIWNTGVRLAAETVQATCFGDFAEYRVDFEFENDGPARTVKLGFPFTTTGYGEEGASTPVGFQAWQDGRPLAVTTVASDWNQKGRVGYYVHTAHFRHGTTMITVSYLASPGGVAVARRRGDQSPSAGVSNDYQYWLHTGATWQGTIGKAVVRYRLADTFCGIDIDLPASDVAKNAAVTSRGWTTPLPRTYQWQFDDFEPTTAARAHSWWVSQSPYDITLGFSTPVTGGTNDPKWTASSAAGGASGSFSASSLSDFGTWAEGVPGLGVGQWVEAHFKHAVRVRELRILPGDTAYDSAFDRYARPRALLAVFSNGTSKLLHFRDAPSLQRFPVDVTTRWVRLVIRSVYRGTDYPATCISDVEFGTQRAPGYAPFPRLIDDPTATGTLPAWAGPPAPTPRGSLGRLGQQQAWNVDSDHEPTDFRALEDYQDYTGGDLIGVSAWAVDQGFPADAPFGQPSSPAALRAMDPTLRLPAARLVGRVTAVYALSYQTFEVSYSSGVDLLVNTRAGDWTVTPLAAARRDETQIMDDYEDGRAHPFDIGLIGGKEVGLAQPGTVPPSSGEAGYKVPGELFWYAGGVSYHLYAPADSWTTGTIVAAARSMILPPVARPKPQPKPAGNAWWPPVAGVGIFAGIVAAVLASARRRRALPAFSDTGR